MNEPDSIKKTVDTPTAGGADWMLQNLISLAKNGIEVPVSLCVNGVVVSGIIVSGERYLDLIGDQLTSTVTGPEEGQAFASWFKDFKDILASDDFDNDGPYFIHLRSASILSGDALVPVDKNLVWRGKLGDVSGYSLGLF